MPMLLAAGAVERPAARRRRLARVGSAMDSGRSEVAELSYDLHHVAVVVGDLEAAMARQAALGFGAGDRFEVPEQGIAAATYRTGGGYLELIQPTDPEGAIGRFLAKRGEGLHHVAYRVPDVAAALDRLRAAGARLIDEAPRSGAHGWRIAFVHPESCNGVLTELVETDEG